ncbi:hypothetical protein F1721_24905 [Saccharopolyspora hirsuta]|uniref:Transmembrane protein n=1 Tax=Saccharopolyspora hirsuta TaxID=1837 RepID=A0A5M7BIX7_SACHI|nr:hypothetical protein [Saccharopolyspora hirsuta]KAA5829559.1 hypothetical protein F1721_24905 [Saccharopolyspora hirsuta]MBF6511086.1 hypothetical protein [Nocardia farcinica]
MNSTDYVRDYTAPRAVLVGAMFVVAVVLRMPAVVLAIAVHALDRGSDRLMAWIDRIPPVPARMATVATDRRQRR